MKSNLHKVSQEIAIQLESKYNYYSSVYFGFIVEAVENALKDFEMEIKPIDEIHKHIQENYI